MKKILTILLILSSMAVEAQQDSLFRLVRTIPLVAADIAVDNLQNLYILTGTGQIKKYNAKGDSTGIYNETRKFGQLHTIDVTNPLSILLFYKDFSTVVLLDRFLSHRSTIDLRKFNVMQVSAAGLSNDNNVWFFDAVENKLKKMDEQGNLLQETVDFRSLFSEQVQPQRIFDQDGKVYLYDPAAGLFIFDYYGSFQQKIPLKDLSNIHVQGNTIRGIGKKGIYLYNTVNFMEKQYELPSSFGSFTNYIIGNTMIYGVSKDAITIYSFHF